MRPRWLCTAGCTRPSWSPLTRGIDDRNTTVAAACVHALVALKSDSAAAKFLERLRKLAAGGWTLDAEKPHFQAAHADWSAERQEIEFDGPRAVKSGAAAHEEIQRLPVELLQGLAAFRYRPAVDTLRASCAARCRSHPA